MITSGRIISNCFHMLDMINVRENAEQKRGTPRCVDLQGEFILVCGVPPLGITLPRVNTFT